MAKFVALAFLLISGQVFADDICGRIPAVKFPSYQFIAAIEAGGSIGQIPVSAEVLMTEAKWQGDHWGFVPHSVPVDISFDAGTGVYSTKEIEVKAPSRFKMKFGCLDQFAAFLVKFNYPPKDQKGFDIERSSQEFRYTFPSLSSTYQLPDSGKVYQMAMKKLDSEKGVFSDATHIKTQGKILTTTWESQPSSNGIADSTSLGLTPQEMQLIKDSQTQGTAVVVYGLLREDGILIIQNVTR